MTVAFQQIQRNDCDDLKNARFQVTIFPNNPLVDRSTISGVALWQAIIIDSLSFASLDDIQRGKERGGATQFLRNQSRQIMPDISKHNPSKFDVVRLLYNDTKGAPPTRLRIIFLKVQLDCM